MLKEKDLILSTKKYAKENKFKSWFFTLSTLTLLILSLGITALNIPIFFRICSSIFSGLLIVRMFVIYHDFLHAAILSHSKIANLIFTVFGIYVLAPKTVWRRTHNFHHKHNAKLFKLSIGSYPVYTKQKFKSLSKIEKNKYLFTRHPLTIFFGYIFTFLYGMCLDPMIKNFKMHFDSFCALIIHVSAQTLLIHFYGFETYILVSLIPHFISGTIGAYLFYAQHNFPTICYANDENWTYLKSALESSSFLDLSRFMHWVTGNIGYHHIHHLNSKIPFYRLPEVMNEVEELKNPKRTNFKFREIVNCLKLKVWDSELQKMVMV